MGVTIRRAPVRDGTCWDDADCDACKRSPPPPVDPPLVKGGQGRDESSMERSARIFAWVLVFLTIGAALLYAAAKVGMVPWGAR